MWRDMHQKRRHLGKWFLTSWRLYDLQTQLAMMLELLAEHHQNFQIVNKRMDEESERNTQRFEKLDVQVGELGSQLRESQAEIRKAVETVERLETKVDTMEERLESKIATVREATEGVRVRTGALEVRVGGIEPQLTALQDEQLRQAEENTEKFREVHAKVCVPASASRALQGYLAHNSSPLPPGSL